MSDRPAAAVVFDDLITALTEIEDGYVLDEQRWTDPTEIAEAFRYVGQVLSASSSCSGRATPTIRALRPSSRPPANCRATIRMRSTTSPGFAATVRTACRSDPRGATPRSRCTGRRWTTGWPAHSSATETVATSPSLTMARTRSSSAQRP